MNLSAGTQGTNDPVSFIRREAPELREDLAARQRITMAEGDKVIALNPSR